MELCPDDEEASCFFVFLFLQHLPAWLRVQLEADDQADIRQLVTRADRLFALGIPCRCAVRHNNGSSCWSIPQRTTWWIPLRCRLLQRCPLPPPRHAQPAGAINRTARYLLLQQHRPVAGRWDSRLSPLPTISAEAAAATAEATQVDSRISPPSAACARRPHCCLHSG